MNFMEHLSLKKGYLATEGEMLKSFTYFETFGNLHLNNLFTISFIILWSGGYSTYCYGSLFVTD